MIIVLSFVVDVLLIVSLMLDIAALRSKPHMLKSQFLRNEEKHPYFQINMHSFFK